MTNDTETVNTTEELESSPGAANGSNVEPYHVSRRRAELGGLDATSDVDGIEPYRYARERVVRTFEREYVSRLLDMTGGNVSKASRIAQMDRSYLIKLIQRARADG